MEIITELRPKILNTKCESIKEFNLNTVSFMNQLSAIMKNNNGLGLSAPQVGLPIRAFVMICQTGQLLKVLNPKILERGKIVTSKKEGCLSIPGRRFDTKRPKRVYVEFRNETGELIKMDLRNMDAFVFQHENDHLNGVLICK